MSALTLGAQALDRLMPLHLRLDARGRIVGAGPVWQRISAEVPLIGRDFFALFTVRRPRGAVCLADLTAGDGVLRLALAPRGETVPVLGFKGLATPAGAEVLINLSFGISLVEAVRRLDLTAADFAPTDLAVELLFLLEAKTAAFDLSRQLTAQIEQARRAARAQALSDPLTGLANRRAMEGALLRLSDRARPVALMQIDLDLFKQVNDTHGHDAGDAVLCHVAAVLRGAARLGDVVARMGGDEFLLMIDAPEGPGPLLPLARRLIAAIERPVTHQGRRLRISASAGIAWNDGRTPVVPQALLKRADRALYQAKGQGRGRAVLAPAEDVPPAPAQDVPPAAVCAQPAGWNAP